MVLTKIKSALAADEKIQALEEQLDNLVKQVELSVQETQKQQEQVSSLTTQIKDLHKEQKKLSKTLENQAGQVEGSVKQFNKVVSELTLFKPKLEKDIINHFKSTLQSELDKTTKELSIDISNREETIKTLNSQLHNATKVSKHIDTLQEVVKGIKASDFELSEHAKLLHKQDQEKLRLMKRIDQLEGMLAKMKRRN